MARFASSVVNRSRSGSSGRPGSVFRHAVRAGVVPVLISGGAVAACEILLAADHVLAAEIGFAGLVVVLVNARVKGPRGTDATAALHVLGIVALARVVAIAAPLPDASATVHLLVVALSTGFALWRLVAPVHAPIRDLVAWRPRTGGGRVLGAGLLLGLVLYGLGAPALVGPDAPVGDVAVALIVVAIAATVEEVLFRGILQSTLERLLGRAGVLLTSALFASLYLSAGSLALFLGMALAGLVFAASVVRARVVGAAVAGHVALAGGAAVVWPALFGAPDALLPSAATAPVLAVAVGVGAWLVFRMPPQASRSDGRRDARGRSPAPARTTRRPRPS
jgi:membrane protease YdiL (CAAX protease family)